MKTLFLDIETSPHIAYVWGLFDKGIIPLDRLVESGSTLCWAAKWRDKKEVMFSSIQDGKVDMLAKIYNLLDEADAVVHYNGSSFDIPTLNKEFLAMGWPPPSPVLQIDLLQTVRKRFRLASNKLNYVSKYLGIGEKTPHKGMELWKGCMEGNAADWKTMKKYNQNDVKLLEQLYDELKPWIVGHPNQGLFTDVDEHVCPTCGSDDVQKRGLHYTQSLTYQRFKCNDCGAWSKARTTNLDKAKRPFILKGIE